MDRDIKPENIQPNPEDHPELDDEGARIRAFIADIAAQKIKLEGAPSWNLLVKRHIERNNTDSMMALIMRYALDEKEEEIETLKARIATLEAQGGS